MAMFESNCDVYSGEASFPKAQAVKAIIETAKLNGVEITESLYFSVIDKVYDVRTKVETTTTKTKEES